MRTVHWGTAIAMLAAGLMAPLPLCAEEIDEGALVMTRADTDWFQGLGWGAFVHYLGSTEMTAEEWNDRIHAFDVKGLAEELEEANVPFIFVTVGQNSGHFCAPNEAYDRLVGIEPSKCSRRDLIADLYDELHPRGIELLVYLPSGAPAGDEEAYTALEWAWGYEGTWKDGPHQVLTGDRLAEFQTNWEAVIREWSERWGTKVRGWWFDGCYFADDMYRHPEPPNFQSFAAAAKAGNPDSLVAFNPGVLHPIISVTEFEDFTAGEIVDPGQVTNEERWVDGAQLFMLSFLGPNWGQSPPRFTDAEALEHTTRITDRGGVVAWDVPILPEGHIPPEFLAQLRALGDAFDAR